MSSIRFPSIGAGFDSPQVDLVIMLGDNGETYPEQLLGAAREGVARDLVEKALSLPAGVRRIVVATGSSSLRAWLADIPEILVVPDEPGQPFYFGRRLLEIVQRFALDRVLYIGGGATPLLTPEQLAGLIEVQCGAPERLVTNNLFSSDWVGFPAAYLERIEPPLRDNDLAWQLAQVGGLDVRQPPRSAGTTFDIDTVTDLVILRLCPSLGRHTTAALRGLDADTSKLETVLTQFRNPEATLLLAGRASSDVWAMMQRRAQCTTRVMAEERGMRASGRLARGEVRSLLGSYAQHFGFDGLFARLGEQASALLLDNRVLFAHLGPWPSDADRCYADLGMPERIEDAAIRRLTEAALAAPIPVVTGGHSLISGGLLALLEATGL